MKTYLSVYLGSTILALIITPIVIKLAYNIKAVSSPSVRDVHTTPVPRIGGVAIYLSAVFLLVMVLFINNSIGVLFRSNLLQLLTLMISATFIFIIGLIDDIKRLPARIKFLIELLAAASLYFVGIRISSITITQQFTINLGFGGCLLTLLWIIGITNAVNLCDGLDGLAAGISAITCGVIAIFALYNGSIVMAVLMLALLGSLSGFLVFNFNPAKVFMGDCGSLFLGFTIASASVMCANKSSALVGLALPVLALGIPIFDTLFSMLRRFIEGRSIFSPDRKHFHHRLIDMGIKQRHVVITIYILTSIITGLGMFMMITHDIDSVLILICIVILLLLLFRLVGSVKLKETISGLKRKYELASRRKQERINFEEAQLHFHDAHFYEQWWSAVCNAAENLDFAWLSFTTEDKNGNVNTEIWQTKNNHSDLSRVVTMTIPLSDIDSSIKHEFEIAIFLNGSCESAGHRATLFNRLIDEYKIKSFA